jgi:sialate O-acetylesterase
MVFASGKPIRIFGTGKGKAEIIFANVSKTIVSEQEQWLVEFPPMECGGPYELTFVSDGETVNFTDIYVGEVYLFAGQSNMQFKVKEGADDFDLCETNEMLRLYSTERIEKTDYFTPKDGWVRAEKGTAPEWSSLAHFAGTKLAREKKIAIGIVVAYQGASVIES